MVPQRQHNTGMSGSIDPLPAACTTSVSGDCSEFPCRELCVFGAYCDWMSFETPLTPNGTGASARGNNSSLVVLRLGFRPLLAETDSNSYRHVAQKDRTDRKKRRNFFGILFLEVISFGFLYLPPRDLSNSFRFLVFIYLHREGGTPAARN